MNYLFFEKETETRAVVTLMYHVTPPPEFDGVPRIEVEEMPLPEPTFAKDAIMYANPTTGEVWFEYIDRPLTPQEENQRLKEKQELMQKALDELILGGAL